MVDYEPHFDLDPDDPPLILLMILVLIIVSTIILFGCLTWLTR